MTPLLIAQTAEAGRTAMHIGLVAVVLIVVIAIVVVRRRRNAAPPIERLDDHLDDSGNETDAQR